MSTSSLVFEIAATASDHLPVLRAELAQALPQHDVSVEQHTLTADNTRSMDPTTVAWIAVLVALPGAVNSTMTLAERLELKPRIEALIAWAARLWKDTGVRIRWGPQGGVRKPLDRAAADEIVQALSRLADQGRSDRP